MQGMQASEAFNVCRTNFSALRLNNWQMILSTQKKHSHINFVGLQKHDWRDGLCGIRRNARNSLFWLAIPNERSKKALPCGASLIQFKSSQVNIRKIVFEALEQSQDRLMDVLAIGLHGEQMGLEKLIKMIDEFAVELKIVHGEDAAWMLPSSSAASQSMASAMSKTNCF